MQGASQNGWEGGRGRRHSACGISHWPTTISKGWPPTGVPSTATSSRPGERLPIEAAREPGSIFPMWMYFRPVSRCSCPSHPSPRGDSATRAPELIPERVQRKEPCMGMDWGGACSPYCGTPSRSVRASRRSPRRCRRTAPSPTRRSPGGCDLAASTWPSYSSVRAGTSSRYYETDLGRPRSAHSHQLPPVQSGRVILSMPRVPQRAGWPVLSTLPVCWRWGASEAGPT